jgi:hypothetical protein
LKERTKELLLLPPPRDAPWITHTRHQEQTFFAFFSKKKAFYFTSSNSRSTNGTIRATSFVTPAALGCI